MTKFQEKCVKEMEELRKLGIEVPRKATEAFDYMTKLEKDHCKVTDAVDIIIMTKGGHNNG